MGLQIITCTFDCDGKERTLTLERNPSETGSDFVDRFGDALVAAKDNCDKFVPPNAPTAPQGFVLTANWVEGATGDAFEVKTYQAPGQTILETQQQHLEVVIPALAKWPV